MVQAGMSKKLAPLVLGLGGVGGLMAAAAPFVTVRAPVVQAVPVQPYYYGGYGGYDGYYGGYGGF